MPDVNLPPNLRISAEERAERLAAVNFARGSVRFEGFTLSAETEEWNRRYVEGEIDDAELSRLIAARFGLAG